MKNFTVIVSGNLIYKVNAKTEKEAENKLKEHLYENSPLRDWEVTTWGRMADEQTDFDHEL